MKSMIEETLEGMLFHGTTDGKISSQGIIKQAGAGYVLLQYYSWLDSSPTHCRLFEIDDLVGCCLFYDSGDAWKVAGDAMRKEAPPPPDSPDQGSEP